MADHTARLDELSAGSTTEQALEFYDSLPAIAAEEMTGRWRGSELSTGHPLDGVLSASGWYGKQFDGLEDVHPLLFSADGEIFAVDPKKVPVSMADRVSPSMIGKARKMLPMAAPAIKTSKYRARLRNLEYRGRVSAAMVYDNLPIIDVFRRVDADTVLGAMDQRGAPGPYMFTLRRD